MTTTPAPSISVIVPTGSEVGPWPTGWTYTDADDVWVYVETNGSPGPDLVLNADYTVTGANPEANGGTVTLAAPAVPEGGWTEEHRLILRRWTVRRQSAAFPDTEGHKPRTTEKALDRAMRIAQEISDDLDRTLQFPPGTVAPSAAELIEPALAKARTAEEVAGNALEIAGQAQADVADALQNGVTNNSGSFLRFPAEGGVSTAGGGEATFLMREAVSNPALVRVFRNGNEVIGKPVGTAGDAHFTVNGTNVGTWTTVMAAAETWNGIHTGSEAANLAARTSCQTDMPGAGARMLSERLNEEWRLTDLAGKKADGVMSWGAALNALFQNAALQGREVIVTPGVYRINDVNVLIPRGTIVRFLPGAMFRTEGGKTCIFRGTVHLPRDVQCFDGFGFLGIRQVQAANFGGVTADYDEGDGSWTTDVAPAINRAQACVLASEASDGGDLLVEWPTGGAFAIGEKINVPAQLHASVRAVGCGHATGDSRFYSVGVEFDDDDDPIPGTGGHIVIDSGADWDDFDAFADFEFGNMAVFGSPHDDECTREPLVTVQGLNSLGFNKITNLLVGEGFINIRERNCRSIIWDRVANRSQTRPGIGHQIVRDDGQVFCGDGIVTGGYHLSQPKEHAISKVACEAGAGPICIDIVNLANDTCPIGVTGYGLGEIRGKFISQVQGYIGKYGTFCRVTMAGTASQKRTMGDFFIDAIQAAAGYDGPVQGFIGLDINLTGHAIVNGLDWRKPWFEAIYGTAIRLTKTAASGITPKFRDITFGEMTLHYSLGRLLEAHGARNLRINGASIENSGKSGFSPTELILLDDCLDIYINRVVVDRDPSDWDGYAMMVRVTGAATRNINVSDCYGGTTNMVVVADEVDEAEVHLTNNRMERT